MGAELQGFFANLQSMLTGFRGVLLPRLVIAASVILVGWLAAAVVRKLVQLGLRSIGVDVLFSRISAGRWMSAGRIKRRPSQMVGSLSYGIVLLAAALAALDVLGMAAASAMLSDLLAFLPRLAAALVMLGLGIYLVEFAVGFIEDIEFPKQSAIGPLLVWVVRLTLLSLVVLAAAEHLGIAVSFLVIGFAAVFGGLALTLVASFGLGGRDYAQDLLSGIVLRRHIGVGDTIQWLDTWVTVQRLGLFAVDLDTAQAARQVVRNSVLYEHGPLLVAPASESGEGADEAR